MNCIAVPATPHFHPGARLLAERGNIDIINHLAARRVREGVRLGERAAPGAARAKVDLVVIRDTLPLTRSQLEDGSAAEIVDITSAGARTARRRAPAILSRMPETSPRRRAAEAFAIAEEKIGAMAGASSEGEKMDGGQAANDGGITTRLHHAWVLRVIKRVTDDLGIALAVRRAAVHAPRNSISYSALMRLVCVDGHDLARVLTDAGWSGQRRDVQQLADAVVLGLDGMARALNLNHSK